LEDFAKGNFSQRSTIKAYAKNSKLAKALKAYDEANSEAKIESNPLNQSVDTYQRFERNASFTEFQNNPITSKIDRQEVVEDNSNYKNETNWRDLLEFKSPQELVDFITDMDWDKFKKDNWDQETINDYNKLNWKEYVSNNSAKDRIYSQQPNEC